MEGVIRMNIVTDAHQEGQTRLCREAERLIALASEELEARESREQGGDEPAPPEQPGSCPEIEMMRFNAQDFLLKKNNQEYQHRYQEFPLIADLVGKIREVIVTTADLSVQDALWDVDAECAGCGECCRHYKVELTPFDIERAARFCRISYDDMWKQYLFPGIFSWNEGNGILAKRDGSILDDEVSRADCIFLTTSKKGYSCCEIYEARPEVCRDYPTDSFRCKQQSRKHKPIEPRANLVSFELKGDILYIETKRTIADEDPPTYLHLKEEKNLRQLCDLLKKEVIRICNWR